MNETEKAYLAGIIDGEGSIMLTKLHKNQYHSPCVSIASTDLELLEWIKDKVGNGTITRKKNYNKIRHKDSFTYTLVYDAAIDFLIAIQTYLVIEKKKLRAKHIIDSYKEVTLRNGRYNEEQKLKKEKFYNDFLAL